MANSLLAPSAIIGLLGQRRNQNSLLPFFQQQADPLDELMAQRAPNGYVETPQGTYYPADQVAQQQQPMQAPQRQRVSGWRVLDRVLGGETITGGLDAERARLTQQAMLPQMQAQQQENERIARALGPQALLALRTNSQALGEGLSAQYKPTTTGAGGVSTVFGTGQQVEAPRVLEFGNDLVQAGPISGTRTLATRGPSYAEQAQMQRVDRDAANDAARLDLDYRRLDQDRSQYERTQGFTESRQANRPISDADQKAIAEAEGKLVRLDTTVGRAQNIIAQLDAGNLNLGPVSNAISGLRNATGNSNEQSLALADLKNWAEEARNEILQSANGVQTEGDAIRALNVILSGTNDERIVKQAIERYVASKAATRSVYERDIARRTTPQMGAGSSAASVPPPPGFVLD